MESEINAQSAVNAQRRIGPTTLSVVVGIALFLSVCGNSISAGSTVPVRLTWFAPESHFPPVPPGDFLRLFQDDAAWEHASRHIDVFELSTQFFVAAPDAIVEQVVRVLDKRHIALGLAAEFSCGAHGALPAYAHAAVDKIKKAGGTLGYIALDEPLWWVHFAPSAMGCHLALKETKERTASIVNVYTAAFPGVIIGEVEPFPILSDQVNWRNVYIDWLRGLEEQIHRPVTFLHIDFDWRSPGLTSGNPETADKEAIGALARKISNFAHDQSLSVGMIYNGKATAGSDMEWLSQAGEHMRILDSFGLRPDQAVFQSWHPFPKHSLPDDEPGTFTNFIIQHSEQKR